MSLNFPIFFNIILCYLDNYLPLSRNCLISIKDTRSRPELCVNKKKGVQLKRKFVIFDLRKKTFTNNILGERYE